MCIDIDTEGQRLPAFAAARRTRYREMKPGIYSYPETARVSYGTPVAEAPDAAW